MRIVYAVKWLDEYGVKLLAIKHTPTFEADTILSFKML